MPAKNKYLYIGDFIEKTDLEGPGNRCAIFLTGCSIRCQGCCNPHLFKQKESQKQAIDSLLNKVLNLKAIEGISLLGGEPLDQAKNLIEFLKLIRQKSNLSIMLYSGYTIAEIKNSDLKRPILDFIDILVDGPYIAELRETKRRFIGSSNQNIYFLTKRYFADDQCFKKENIVELRLKKDELRILGFPFK